MVASAISLLVIPRFQDMRSYPNPWDQDEAVYLETARAITLGHPLYKPTFCAQPPVTPEILALGFRLFGDSVETGRLVTLLIGCAGLLGASLIAWRLGGGAAAGVAAVALASSYLYARQSWYCEAEAASITFTLLGMAAALESANRRSSLWAGASGALFAVGAMSKLLVVPLAAPAVLALALRRDDRGWKFGVDRCTFVSLAFAIVGALAGVLLLAVPHPFAELYEQAIRFHFVKAGNYDRSGNFGVLAHYTLRECGIVFLAAVGLFAGVVTPGQRAMFGWIMVWLASASGFLLTHRPLHPHHVVLLLPALCVLAGVGASAITFNRLWVVVGVAAASLVCIDRDVHGIRFGRDYCVTLAPVRNYERLVNRPMGANAADMIIALREHTKESDWVDTDDPKLAYWAGRAMPPSMCDPSIERIEASFLTFEDAVGGTRSARAVILWRGWLEKIPGFGAWVREHYCSVLAIDEQRILFVKKE
jgi:4-amino-4-deoxy-L-arabinose transferase-like glycosyltransferase